MPGPDTGPINDAVRAVFDEKFAARELAIGNSRRVIRSSANAIRALHRDDAEAADELMAEAAEALAEATAGVAEHHDIRHAGFMNDAAKEYSEARLTAALLAQDPLPTPEDLGVGAAPFLNGLGEAVGELRRSMLGQLRRGDLDGAEATFAAMETVQDLLETIDYPDAMTGGLRRTTDVSRSLIERSRADLTTTVVQERLRRQLEDAAEE